MMLICASRINVGSDEGYAYEQRCGLESETIWQEDACVCTVGGFVYACSKVFYVLTRVSMAALIAIIEPVSLCGEGDGWMRDRLTFSSDTGISKEHPRSGHVEHRVGYVGCELC